MQCFWRGNFCIKNPPVRPQHLWALYGLQPIVSLMASLPLCKQERFSVAFTKLMVTESPDFGQASLLQTMDPDTAKEGAAYLDNGTDN